jgi:hypothetical protein
MAPSFYFLPPIYLGPTSYLPTCLALYNLPKFMYLQPTYLQLYYTYLSTYLLTPTFLPPYNLPTFSTFLFTYPNLPMTCTLPSLMNGVWNGRIKF